MRLTFGRLTLVVIAMSLWLPAGAFAANVAASGPLEAAMQYAPQGVIACIHVEVRSCVADVFTAIELQKDLLGAKTAARLRKLLTKVDSIDLFLMPTETAMMPFGVIRGKFTAQEVREALDTQNGSTTSTPLEKGANGRYALTGLASMPLVLVIGGEADDVPAGVNLIGVGPMLTPERVADLGKARLDALTALLKDVDTAAPAWFAIDLRQGCLAAAGGGGPQTIRGSVFIAGGGRSAVTVDFADANAAGRFEAVLAAEKPQSLLGIVVPLVNWQRDGASVKIESKTGEAVAGPICEGYARLLEQSRQQARRDLAQLYLRQIGTVFAMYQLVHNNEIPADLSSLIKEGLAARYLVSPNSGKKLKLDASGSPVGEADYIYIKYPRLPEKPSEYILVYERPEIYGGQGTNVLFGDLRCEWVPQDEFDKLLAKTKEWLAAHEK